MKLTVLPRREATASLGEHRCAEIGSSLLHFHHCATSPKNVNGNFTALICVHFGK